MTEKAKITIQGLECTKIEEKTVETEDKGEVTTYKYVFEGEHNITITSVMSLSIDIGQEFTAKFYDPQTKLDDHKED